MFLVPSVASLCFSTSFLSDTKATKLPNSTMDSYVRKFTILNAPINPILLTPKKEFIPLLSSMTWENRRKGKSGWPAGNSNTNSVAFSSATTMGSNNYYGNFRTTFYY